MMSWRAGPDGERSDFNAAWLAFTGRSLERERGAGWAEGVHPDEADACLARHREHVTQRLPFELRYRLRRFDGEYREVVDRGMPYVDAEGAFAGFYGTCADVGDRHDGDFFEMSLDNLCVAGFDGYLKRVNPSWTRTLGWTAEELLSRPSVEFVHPEDRDATLAGRHRLTTGSALGPLVNRYLCKDGSFRWFEWRSVAHADRGLVYAAARDITEQKRAEESLSRAKALQETLQRQLVFADRMASVGTLAAGVAHEINNPLAVVMANVELIVEELAAADPVVLPRQLDELRQLATDARQGAERIRKIVRGLKTFSRVEDERWIAFDVRAVLETAIDMTLNEIRHRARLVKDYREVPLVAGDDGRLVQVFVNLLVNAAQALPVGDSDANEIRVVTSTDAAGRAVIEVHDTGAGIPVAIADRIFDPFFTTKPVGIGTGLGLSICHNIVRGMGGEITVSSEEGRGTSFRITLPASRAPEARAASEAPRPARAARRGVVLVVDDEPAIGGALRRVLRGHDVTAVTTAREALELLRSGKRFDVIVSDLMMPEMSGMDFHDALVRSFPDHAERVVFVSGGAFTPAASAFLERVPNERIEKPFDPERVREIVQRFVG